ncbi:MAG: hypothetical protein V1837_08315 [Candidatus Woesearchaeota archaeon]
MLDLNSLESYKETVLTELERQLKAYFGSIENLSIEEIRKKVVEINTYQNIGHLRNAENIKVLDDKNTSEAEKTILAGRFFTEHTAAGEATRLGLGTKYLLKLNEFSMQKIRALIINEYLDNKPGKSEEEAELQAQRLMELIDFEPNELEAMTLGERHMTQMAFDLVKLAKKHGKPAAEVLARQKILMVLNEQTAKEILDKFENHNYYGFLNKNVHFMIQQSFHGISIQQGKLSYDEASPKRLHNHGQMLMQKCHEGSIFVHGEETRALTFKEYLKMLQEMEDMLSYNIEDIGYLENSIDLASLQASLDLGRLGYNMVMEVVAQNPYKPQKGGACFFDVKLGKTVMVETNRLGDIKYEDIKYLNKNFNHYPNPANSILELKKQGIDLPFEIKGQPNNEYIYPCPIQGDLNFKVKTAFVMRKTLKPIANFKSPATLPATMKAMQMQDNQDGFLDFRDRLREGL